MKKILTTYIFTYFVSSFVAQTPLTIPVIQGAGYSTPHNDKFIKTSGVVTAKYLGTGKIGGFFIQDPLGDADFNTSDGIFVSTSTDNVKVGDRIQLTATVNEYFGRTQLVNPSSITVLASNQSLPVTKVIYDPATFNWEKYEGMLLEFDQTLFVNSNRNLRQYGELELGDKRKTSPTNIALPGSTQYQALVNANSYTPIYFDDALVSAYNVPIVFADNQGTRRTGEKLKNLRAIVDNSSSKYLIYPATFPVAFFGNQRPLTPFNLGDYNLKVCGFNLEYYLTVPNTSGMGPTSDAEMLNQHTKIIAALKAIDADIYGLIEIEQGQEALTKLVNALISSTGKPFAYVNDGLTINGTWTKVAFLYRSDKVSPYLQYKKNNSVGPLNRKLMQAFTLKSNNERFIFSINHFKAKSGCGSASGNDSDQYDGQSCYNATRTNEANSVIQAAVSNSVYYSDDDVLVMGDLNAYAKEDPIRAFTDYGYKDLHQQFNPDTSYSYVYSGEAGYLDHAIASESMAKQVTGVCTFHINADEPTMFEYNGVGYQPNMYRCSDHDPVVVGLKLGTSSNASVSFDSKVKVYPSLTEDSFTVANVENGYIEIFSLGGIKLYSGKISNNVQKFSTKAMNIQSGTYIIRLLDEKSIARRVLFVK